MNIDIASIKDLGIPTIFVIFGLFLLGLTFIDLSRSEGKWQFKTRKKYPWPLGITAVILIVAGIALQFTPFNPDAPDQESLKNATATISFLQTHIAEQKSAAETTQSAAETTQSAAETQVAIAKSAAETQKAIAQTATATIVALSKQLADAQATSAASSETLVALQATQTGEAGTLLGTISAQATKLADALTAIPPTPEPPPQALITEVKKIFSTTHEKLLKPKENATLDDRFHDDAKQVIEGEISTIQNVFSEIKEPKWEVEVEAFDLYKEVGIQKYYYLTTNQMITFYGKCPNEENFRSVDVKYPKSVIGATVTDDPDNSDSVTERFYFVYNVFLDHVDQGEFCKVIPTQ
jgi:hypothetical protein